MLKEDFLSDLKDIVKRAEHEPGYINVMVDDVVELVEEYRDDEEDEGRG